MSAVDFEAFCPDCGSGLTLETNLQTGDEEPYCWTCGIFPEAVRHA